LFEVQGFNARIVSENSLPKGKGRARIPRIKKRALYP
jgi:hypothetical protein